MKNLLKLLGCSLVAFAIGCGDQAPSTPAGGTTPVMDPAKAMEASQKAGEAANKADEAADKAGDAADEAKKAVEGEEKKEDAAKEDAPKEEK